MTAEALSAQTELHGSKVSVRPAKAVPGRQAPSFPESPKRAGRSRLQLTRPGDRANHGAEALSSAERHLC